MLAYVFWHRPRDGTGAEAYEQAHLAFHRSIAHTPPMGLRGSGTFRVAEIPWLEAGVSPAEGGGAPPGGYEDWYLLADFTALGVLNEAAVGRGHRTSHDRVARGFGAGAGGVYCLLEGEPLNSEIQPGEPSLAIWIARPPERPAGSSRRGLGDLLGDGMDPRHASLWRRQLVLGPAPEFCLLTPEVSAGVAAARLPAGWISRTVVREALFSA